MKNFKFIVSFLLLNLTIFSGCQKQNIISPNQSFQSVNVDAEIVSDAQACDPSFPTITSSSTLFKYRYGVSLYRFYARIYLDYKRRADMTPPRAISTIKVEVSDLVRLGLKEISPAAASTIIDDGAINLSRICYENYRGTQRNSWEMLKVLVDLCINYPLSTQQAIVTKANGWGDSVPVNSSANIEGSYTIAFSSPTGYTYSGKGGGIQGVVGRCKESANARCSNSPTIADAQKAATLSNFSLEIQAFKEEAVRMYVAGFLAKDDPGSTFNNIQSKGVGYINTDKI
jgi:hypothetical protein